ncbi:MAG TPA: class I SAM-dependent methyltransferase [Candidatus Binatia bacterium]|nr:class I SAM-dependent methyltransferase [Candidatus Binatia bacterium]
MGPSFFASGEQDYARLVEPVLQTFGFAASGKSVVEFGCGAGRMTRSFAQHFQSVFAVDISSEMQARAKSYLSEFSNICWVLSDGESISEIPDNHVDLVFSYLVLQHMPSREIVFRVICEMIRILRPGGIFLFQFNGSSRPTMNWRGCMISGLLDGLASMGLRSMSRNLAQLVSIDPDMVGKTWRGVAITKDEIAHAVRACGASPEGFLDPDTPLAWNFGRKAGGKA